MRKNKMMRLASCLLVAVLLTTSMISGTFAKYVTTASGSDSARVAKWGFDTTTIVMEDLFASTYGDTVAGKDGAEVIAPGTEGKQVIKFDTVDSVAPEVDYKFDVTASTTAAPTNTILTNPNIKWAFYAEGTDPAWGTFDAMLTSIKAQSVPKVEANALPALSDNYVVAWKWIFDENAANKETDTVNNDLNDTAMGNADTLEEINLEISITATQID